MGKKVNLSEIVRVCEERFARGSAANWKHSDFNDLSRSILRDTGIAISGHTLKRIFGKIAVDEDYLPQQATLDALIRYGNYKVAKSDFGDTTETAVRDKPLDKEAQELTTPESKKSSEPEVKEIARVSPRWIYMLIIVAITLVAGFVLIKLRSQQYKLASISIADREGLLPATIFFDVTLPDTKDSVFIDYGDKSEWQYIYPETKKVSHIYLIPGVFKPMIVSRKQRYATSTVSIGSDGWVALGFRRQRDLPEHYFAFPAVKTGADSLFHISNEQLNSVGLDTTASLYTRLSNFSATGNKWEDFVLESTFKNAVTNNGIYCNTVQFVIAGMNGMIRFRLASPGCTSSVLNNVSELVFSGKEMNLSQFAVNLRVWNNVKILNEDKRVMFYLNDKLLFEQLYRQPLGEIKGVFLEFGGIGYVKKCDLKTLKGEILYNF